MSIEEIKNQIDSLKEVFPVVLILNKDIYARYKEEIDNLIAGSDVDLVITNYLDPKQVAIIMDKRKFYGIE